MRACHRQASRGHLDTTPGAAGVSAVLEVSACRDDTLTGGGDDEDVRRDTVGSEVVPFGLRLDRFGRCAVMALGEDQRVTAWGEDCDGVSLQGDS